MRYHRAKTAYTVYSVQFVLLALFTLLILFSVLTLFTLLALLTLLTLLPPLTLLTLLTLLHLCSKKAIVHDMAIIILYGLLSKMLDWVSGWSGYPLDCYDY